MDAFAFWMEAFGFWLVHGVILQAIGDLADAANADARLATFTRRRSPPSTSAAGMDRRFFGIEAPRIKSNLIFRDSVARSGCFVRRLDIERKN
ncbi:hypothetical protein CWO90_12120 [Bradyrhizobium sp. Leo121]|nr:hypothetical protein CWO90_12120 [Bradyrhizobium sp. Leo121]